MAPALTHKERRSANGDDQYKCRLSLVAKSGALTIDGPPDEPDARRQDIWLYQKKHRGTALCRNPPQKQPRRTREPRVYSEAGAPTTDHSSGSNNRSAINLKTGQPVPFRFSKFNSSMPIYSTWNRTSGRDDFVDNITPSGSDSEEIKKPEITQTMTNGPKTSIKPTARIKNCKITDQNDFADNITLGSGDIKKPGVTQTRTNNRKTRVIPIAKLKSCETTINRVQTRGSLEDRRTDGTVGSRETGTTGSNTSVCSTELFDRSSLKHRQTSNNDSPLVNDDLKEFNSMSVTSSFESSGFNFLDEVLCGSPRDMMRDAARAVRGVVKNSHDYAHCEFLPVIDARGYDIFANTKYFSKFDSQDSGAAAYN